MASQYCPGGCQVVPVWKFVAVWPLEKEEEIILISDDEDEVQCPGDDEDEVQCPGDDEDEVQCPGDDDDSTQGSSVVFVEPQEDSPLEENRLEEMVDEEEDLVVTYCQRGTVMPHARHDCTEHPFERTESDTCYPLGKNADICDECYCYVCDKLAAACQFWTVPSLCHCNAHNKSSFWKEQRSFALVGILATFKLDLLDLDAELRHGGELLENFIKDLSVAYNEYLRGERVCPPGHECCCELKLPPGQCNDCSSQKMEVVYKYSDVYELVTRFLNQAEQERPKAAAVMLLGAAKEIALHKDPTVIRSFHDLDHTASLRVAVPFLFQRITTRLQRMLVVCEFPKFLFEKFVEFFQSIPLPCHCYAFTNCLNVLHWEHVLLTTVLRGQNITGHKKQKGKKMFLWEARPVLEARVEKLLEKKKYKELVRYLRIVKCNENKRLQQFRDLIPFYLCKSGLFLDAAHSMLFPVNSLSCCSACRIAPCQFKIYLKIFRTGCVPSGSDLVETETWVTVGSPLKNTVLIKQVLKLFYGSLLLYRNVKYWSSFIMILGTSEWLDKKGQLLPLCLEEPSLVFKENVLAASSNFLKDLKSGVNASLPSAIFSGQLQHEASLILAVQAVQQMLYSELPYLASFLEIVLAFGKNFWALRLLLDQLSCDEHILHGTANLLLRDMSREEASVLREWQNLGPQHVGEFMCVFLTSRYKRMQSVGLFSLRVVIDNLHLCPWAKQLCTFFKESGLRQLPFGTTVHYEVSKFVSTFENL